MSGTTFMTRLMRALRLSRKGASSTEYALLIGLICIGIVTGATLLGSNLNDSLYNSASVLGPAK